MLQLPQSSIKSATRATSKTAEQKSIEAGKAFETLLMQDYLPVNAKWRRLYQKTCDTTAKKFESFRTSSGDSPAWKYFRRVSKTNGYDAISTRQSDIHTELDRLAEIIRSVPPRTIEGLRAYFLISVFDCQPFGAEDDSMSFSDEVAHERLFDAVASFVGISRSAMTARSE